MLNAVMKSGCENLKRLDLVHLNRFEMYSRLLTAKCPCLQELMSSNQTPSSTSKDRKTKNGTS